MLEEMTGVEIVGQAGTVGEAIDAISQLLPDVVILGLRMPGGNGIDVLQQIKQSGVESVVIILTTITPLPGTGKNVSMPAQTSFWINQRSLTKSRNWLSASGRSAKFNRCY